jgi:hypothetical protein
LKTPCSIIQNAVAQYFEFHPGLATPWMVAAWLENKDAHGTVGPTTALLERVERACRALCDRGELARTHGEAVNADDDARNGILYYKQYAAAVPTSADESPALRPRIVCISGSSRFIDQVALKAWEFERGGAICLAMHLLPHAPGVQAHHQAEHEGIATQMDNLHLQKIDLADVLFVMNVDGYLGEQTKAEIAYALAHGKPVEYLESIA